MKEKAFINKNNFYIFLLFSISILINNHYANLGALPVDTFLHFDLSFKILKGMVPFSDMPLSYCFTSYKQKKFQDDNRIQAYIF